MHLGLARRRPDELGWRLGLIQVVSWDARMVGDMPCLLPVLPSVNVPWCLAGESRVHPGAAEVQWWVDSVCVWCFRSGVTIPVVIVILIRAAHDWREVEGDILDI
jgi:hypothetical protein